MIYNICGFQLKVNIFFFFEKNFPKSLCLANLPSRGENPYRITPRWKIIDSYPE